MKLEQNYKTGLHVIHFFNGASLVFLIGYLLWHTKIMAGLLCFKFVIDLLHFISAEIYLTSNKLIYRKGFFHRKTFEFDCSKLESITIEQSVVGRILDYGDIRINEKQCFKHVRQPFELKRRLQVFGENHNKIEKI